MSLWIKNTDDQHDAVLTLAVSAFIIVAIKVLLTGVEIKSIGVSFGSIDSTIIASMLTPTLGSYVLRRYTDRKFPAILGTEEK